MWIIMKWLIGENKKDDNYESLWEAKHSSSFIHSLQRIYKLLKLPSALLKKKTKKTEDDLLELPGGNIPRSS